MFLKRRLEDGRTEENTAEAERIHLLREPFGDRPRRARSFERPRSASSLRHVCALEQHGAGIHNRRVERRHVRRWHHPRQLRHVEVHPARPAVHVDDFEIGSDPELGVEQLRELADGHAVAHRERQEVGDARDGPRRRDVPLDHVAPDRVGAIEHHDRLPAPGRVRHEHYGRRGVAVVAGADVLQVHEEQVHCIERGDRG